MGEDIESLEKSSLRIGRDSDGSRWSPLFFIYSGKSMDSLLMKPEHNQSCGLPFTDTKKNSPRLFQSKKVPQNTPGSRPTLQAAIKLWGKTPDHQLTRKTRLRTLPHAPINEGET